MREVMALVLAGGSGGRLSVLAAERAVSAVPFGGKYRIIDFVLSNCCHSGIRHVGVLTQHAPASLHDHIGSGRAWDLDGRDEGVFILQPFMTRDRAGWYRGGADAIAQNWDTIEESRAARVLVLSGDHVYKMDYRALIHAHARSGAAVTVAVVPIDPGESRRFGMVTTDGEGRVLAFDEKPERSDARLASMGVYLFETEVLREAARGRPVDVALDILRPLVAAGEHVHAHEFGGYWEDVGEIATFYRANLDLLMPDPRLLLHDARWPILTRDEERSPALFLPGADVEDSLIANGCRVAGRVRNSVLFPGVTVLPGAEIVDSVVMQDVGVSRSARIRRAIVDKFAHVGEGVAIGAGERSGDSALAWLDGLTLVGKDSVIPEGATVASEVVIGVGAGAADFARPLTPGTRIADRLATQGLV
ncbi:MAG: glucose-1-phosphate adenylyltransferase [Candidatus Eisenbacteria bacterium]|uniref:Glucose-1-phosphate adenylyltransferase n=1 Tax=Eiseniibacteriota bacterium TaxID=2212470 RepID=A0A9D6QJ97_UNCEI|nr:glucose-1-phosphate adenylyltransferase [Candidatus Eisenbacteria bacterium]MBI3539000.1 glucose-1-phosphate adenylyltransferase [Candidatus Eisenbacteria bacterium]